MIPQVGTPHARILDEATTHRFARNSDESTRFKRPVVVEILFDLDGRLPAPCIVSMSKVPGSQQPRCLIGTELQAIFPSSRFHLAYFQQAGAGEGAHARHVRLTLLSDYFAVLRCVNPVRRSAVRLGSNAICV
jgi:hypothetical protein